MRIIEPAGLLTAAITLASLGAPVTAFAAWPTAATTAPASSTPALPTPASSTPASSTPASSTPASPTTAPSAAASPAAPGSGNARFPSAVSPKYASQKAGDARMHTCLDQYHANKATNGNGGLKWIQKGGGYYSVCSKKLKS